MPKLENFADRLERAIDQRSSCLVVGLDPVLDRLPPDIHTMVGGYTGTLDGPSEINSARAGLALTQFCIEVIDAVAEHAVAVKPNVAFFERFGPAAWDGLAEVCRVARQRGLLVVLDAKRGDLSSTAEAYADALLGEQRDTVGPYVDALTVNPYFGEDGIRPFIDVASAHGKGLFILVRTSNPSAKELQDLVADGSPLYVHVAEAVARWGGDEVGECGLSAVGAVVGATAPEEAVRVREVLPSVPFLVPGFGAQGAGADAIRPHFLSGGRGVIVNASRSVIFAFEKHPERPWKECVAEAAAEARETLEAVRRTV